MENVRTQRHFTQFKQKFSQYGWRRTSHLLMIKAIKLIGLFKLLRGMLLLKVNPSYLECPSDYTCRFLSRAQLRHYAQDPENHIEADFLNEALEKGDRCYAILDGDKLAAYSWYSHQQTRIDPGDLLIDFNPHYVYIYKGLTKPEYRGQRLYVIGMNRAFQWYQQRGSQGMISYVESTNFESLNACMRLGCQIFGTLCLMRFLGRYLLLATPSCSRFGFRLQESAHAVLDWERGQPGVTALGYPLSTGERASAADCGS